MFTNPAKYQFKIGTYYSADGGRTWHDSGPLPGFGNFDLTSDVSIAFSRTGVAYVVVLAVVDKGSGIFVSKSIDGGKTFSKPSEVFFDTSGGTFSDKPWIAVDDTTGPNAGTIYVAWNLDGGSDARDPDLGNRGAGLSWQNQQTLDAPTGMDLSRSTDGGKTWSVPVVIAPFTDAAFPLGAIPAVAPDGRVHVVYASIDNHSNLVTQLMMVTSADGGQTFSAPQTIAQVEGLPNHLGTTTFRNLSLPSFAISPRDGSMVVTWADMRNGDADVYASSSLDGGASWSHAVRVNHDRVGNGKDQFQPVIAASPNGTYTCGWFDRRSDPANRLINEEIAQSTNDGLSFGHNFRVTTKPWDPSIDAPEPEGKNTNTFIGDYQGLAVDNTTIHPLWNDTQNGRTQEIRTSVISVRQLQLAEQTLARKRP